MALKDLATLYDEKVADLYRYDAKDFQSGEPLYQNKLKPGEMGDNIKFDSRSLPISSAVRDVERMTKFTFSGKGLLFMAEQQILQSGNAFGQTAILNPAFVVANTIPFIHLSRHLSGMGIFNAPNSIRGRLQKTTGEEAYQKAMQSMATIGDGKQRAIRASSSGFLDGLLQQVKGTISNVKANLDPKSAVYGEGDRPDKDQFDKLLVQNSTDATAIVTAIESFVLGVPLSVPKPKVTIASRPESITGTGVPGTATQNTSPLANKLTGKLYDPDFVGTKTILSYAQYRDAIRARYASKPHPITGKNEISYFNDQQMAKLAKDGLLPYKVTGLEYTVAQMNNLYKFVGTPEQPTPDFINVFIGVPSKNKQVQFRAFVKDVKQSSKPEYAASKYIGRTEKYVTYSGTSRTTAFTLTLAAFSKEELDGMYAKLNYLVGLTFPLGIATGTNVKNPLVAPQLLQPPMVSLTLGKILVAQPGYFENISIQYGESYDLARQLPMLATVIISYAILEKETMFYTNPTVGEFQQLNPVVPAEVAAALSNIPLLVPG